MTRASGPEVSRLEGARVAIRPFRPAEMEAVWRSHLASSDWPMGRPSRRRVRSRVAHSGRFHRGFLFLAIESDGRPAGEIQAWGGEERSLPPGTVEIGIYLWDPSDRGHGYGTEAVALLTSWLFEQPAMQRVQASTDVANAPLRRSLERLGFRREGTMRGFMPSATGREDYALYAVVKREWVKREWVPRP